MNKAEFPLKTTKKCASLEQVISRILNFDFKRVFDENSTQSEIFQKSAVPIFEAVMQGYNGCIITYGQASSGKTHTITGQTKDIEQMGSIPLKRDHTKDSSLSI